MSSPDELPDGPAWPADRSYEEDRRSIAAQRWAAFLGVCTLIVVTLLVIGGLMVVGIFVMFAVGLSHWGSNK